MELTQIYGCSLERIQFMVDWFIEKGFDPRGDTFEDDIKLHLG